MTKKKSEQWPCQNCGQRPTKDGFTYWCEECRKEAETTLFAFMTAWDDDDLPDGAWWAMLEEGVHSYNQINRTHYDPFNSVHMFLQSETGGYEVTEEKVATKNEKT